MVGALLAAVPRSGASPPPAAIVVVAAIVRLLLLGVSEAAAAAPSTVAVPALMVLSGIAVLLRVSPLLPRPTLRHELLPVPSAGDASPPAAPALVSAVAPAAAEVVRLELVLREDGTVAREHRRIEVDSGSRVPGIRGLQEARITRVEGLLSR